MSISASFRVWKGDTSVRGRHRAPRGGWARRTGTPWLVVAFAVALMAPAVQAGPADVVSAKATCSAASVCTFSVTVKHDDEGWEHYADRWDVIAPDGKVLSTRVLRHPHVSEQPFTRKLDRVRIPAGVEKVRIRAHDSVHGLGGAEVEVEIERGEK
jgi:hypothetical protein